MEDLSGMLFCIICLTERNKKHILIVVFTALLNLFLTGENFHHWWRVDKNEEPAYNYEFCLEEFLDLCISTLLSFPLPDCSRCRLPNPQSVDRSRFYLSGLGCSLLRETHFLLLSTASCSPGLCFCCWLFLFCLLCVTGLGPWVSCFNSLTSDPVLPCPCTCWI